ncbi:MAG: S8 family peptidase [Blautia sp.]|nr:S8 family peptidase [Blautia sp.]MDY4515324.1 S8 family peptidase [Lachnospiraceae bacterium]
MNEEEIREMILSNDYLDFIRNFKSSPEVWLQEYENYGAQAFGGGFGMVHIRRDLFSGNPMETLGYYAVPKLFTTLDTTSLEVSGILQVQTQPLLNYTGKDIILGFIDTGIDYTLPAFRRSDGSSRILRIWDQTIQTGNSPENIFYGSVYTREQMNDALASESPYMVVPSRDEDGHGTLIAGIAAGSPDPSQDFTGAAPGADLVIVKLKPAKQNLRDFYLIRENALAFQETDIMMAMRYLLEVSYELQKPIVICLGLGSTQGSHTGDSPLAQILTYYSGFTGCYITVAAGNEAGMGHHFYGKIDEPGGMQTAEILVNESDRGFSLELWGQPPELYSVGIVSPLGETIQRIPARLGQSVTLRFTLERTVIELYYEIVEAASGNELILLRFRNPTPGIWTIRVYNDVFINGVFHMWLPVTGFLSQDTVFLAPNPDTTLTTPSSTEEVITISTYNAYNGSLFINSSRGYTKDGKIKPDIAAPGVNVPGPQISGGYAAYTGSSVAAAITAGAVALLVNWGMDQNPDRLFTNFEVQGFLIRGATRSPQFLYPNREWGFGTLNLYQIFQNLMEQ